MKQKANALRWWLIPGTLLVIVTGSGLWYSSGSSGITVEMSGKPGTKSPSQTEIAYNHVLPEVNHPSSTAYKTPPRLSSPPIAPSLEGTDIDGTLQATADGQLVVNLEVRDFFDYFLSTVGEVSPETAITQIQHMAQQYLPEPASSQAITLLEQYLAYKQASLDVLQTELDPSRQHDAAYQLEALGSALAQLKQLRQQIFSPEAHQAFFRQEEAYSEYTLATLGIQQRTDLTEQSKQALLNWHRNQLPDTLKSTEQHLHADIQQQQQRIAAMASASSPEMAGQQLIDMGLDPESADDVVSYLQQRQAFNQRFEAFHEAIKHQQKAGLANTTEKEYQAHLLEQYFPDQQEQTWAKLKLLDQS